MVRLAVGFAPTDPFSSGTACSSTKLPHTTLAFMALLEYMNATRQREHVGDGDGDGGISASAVAAAAASPLVFKLR